jgi:hypothetical protein
MALEIDVLPSEPEELSPAHSGQHGAQEQRVHRLVRGIEEPPDLGRRQDHNLPFLAPRPLRVVGRICVEVTPLDRVLEHLLEHHHHVEDGLGRVLLGQQGLHELPHVRQRDRVEPNLAEERDHV